MNYFYDDTKKNEYLYAQEEEYRHNGKVIEYPNTTKMKPMEEKEGFVILWNGTEWEQLENHVGEQGFVNNEPFRIEEYGAYQQDWTSEYVKSLQELKDEAKQNLESLTTQLRVKEATFNGITVCKTYENINEWLTFAKYKNDPNITIPAQAVIMSYSGQNMNSFSVPQIEGAMYQAMQAITTINADYYTTLAQIENATTAEEIPNIQG